MTAIFVACNVIHLHADPDKISSETKLTITSEQLRPKGEFRAVEMPETLDLAFHAGLAINMLTENVDPDHFYGVYQVIEFLKEPIGRKSLTWNILPKHTRTLPLLRQMCGSEQNLETEAGMIQALIDQVSVDGQVYYPFDGEAPPKGTSYPQTNALIAFSLSNYNAINPDPRWLSYLDLICRGLQKSAIRVENRAYYPMQSGIDAAGRWHFMNHDSKVTIPYTPPDEPLSDQQGLEGAAKSDQSRCISALVLHHRLTGDEASLELAGRLLAFNMKPGMWSKTDKEEAPGNEHGVFSGHFHNNVQGLIAILDFARATGDYRLMQFVREGYEYARRQGVARAGWFPMWISPSKFSRPSGLFEVNEPCAISDMLVLAAKLTDVGLGDYWDDVDGIIRNQLITQQLTDPKQVFGRTADAGKASNRGELGKYLGGFMIGGPTVAEWDQMPACCSVNGAQALYYAWQGIVRQDGDAACINLFLNRVSPWADVLSHLPNEGKVEIVNHASKRILIRVPNWVNPDEIRLQVDGKPIAPKFMARRLLLENLSPGSVIVVEFPIKETTDEYSIGGKPHRIIFRGSTVVDISPRNADPNKIPLYADRQKMRSPEVPLRERSMFVSDRLVDPITY